MFQRCIVCGVSFEKNHNAQKCCSKECSEIHKKEYDRQKQKEYRTEKAIYTKTCKGCGSEFRTYTEKQLFCCQQCARKHRKYKKICVICGKEYISGQKNSLFCSPECRYQYQKETGCNKIHTQICKYCGRSFNSAVKQRTYCSEECANKDKTKHDSICINCEKEFTKDKRKSGKFCSRECFLNFIGGNKWANKNHNKLDDSTSIRRAKKFNVKYEHIDPLEIYERDNWICKICGKPVDGNLAYPNPMSASLDHIKALSRGGTHTKDNVQLAHLLCNIKKSNH